MMETHKVQFNFTPSALVELDRLKEQIRAPSRAETIRYALKVLQWVADEVAKNNKICLETKDGLREVLIIPVVTTKEDQLAR